MIIGPKIKQQADFIKYYMGEACYNAAKLASYSEKTAYSIGNELRKKPHIKAVIEIAFIMQSYDIRRSGRGSNWPEQTVHELVHEYLK